VTIDACHANPVLNHVLCDWPPRATAEVKYLYAFAKSVDEPVVPDLIVPTVRLTITIPRNRVLLVMSDNTVS
jgi:hypothetical protein